MSIEEMEKRLRNLEDIEEIKQLQVSYVNYLITTEWDQLVDCFAENGIVDLYSGYATGKNEISKLFKEKISVTHIGHEGLSVVHPVIKVDGDKAKGSWLLYTHFSQPHKIQVFTNPPTEADAPDWMQGYYEMEYVRENGKWKISQLKWRRRLLSPRPPE